MSPRRAVHFQDWTKRDCTSSRNSWRLSYRRRSVWPITFFAALHINAAWWSLLATSVRRRFIRHLAFRNRTTLISISRVLETQIISLSRICIDSIAESGIHSGQLQHSRTCFANAKRFELSTAAAAGLRAVFSFASPMPPSRPLLVVVFINMFAKKIENFTNDALNIDGRRRHDSGRFKVIEVWAELSRSSNLTRSGSSSLLVWACISVLAVDSDKLRLLMMQNNAYRNHLRLSTIWNNCRTSFLLNTNKSWRLLVCRHSADAFSNEITAGPSWDKTSVDLAL